MATFRNAPAPRSPDELCGSTIGRYVIQSLVGCGGMGEVYCAQDTALHRPVAFKRLAPRLASDPRFRQGLLKEAERLGALSSPHIASLHDVLEQDGEMFLVMEFVEGGSLRQRLHAPMAVNQFLPIATQCAQALAEAHSKGIVHQDLKPENILLTSGGQVKVLDFGLARYVPSPDATATVTEAAVGGGTCGYTAPEALLEKPVDARSDIFSLGVVFYEMLAGLHPFRAAGVVATNDRILHEKPLRLRELNREVPAALERIVDRMLEKDPELRYPDAAALLAELNSLPARPVRPWLSRLAHVLIVVLLVAVIILAVNVPLSRQAPPLPAQRYVAVLPFRGIAGAEQNQAMVDGLRETLTARLSHLGQAPDLQVVPASAVRRQNVITPDQARRELGVNLAVEGTVHPVAGQVRVTFSLVDTGSGRLLQADTITASAGDLFALEDRIVSGVVRMMELAGGDTPAGQPRGTSVQQAHQLFLQGRGELQAFDNPQMVERAIQSFRSALQVDDSYALAHAALGEAYLRKFDHTHAAVWIDGARTACTRALALLPSLADARICLAGVHNRTGQYEDAVRELNRAIAADPTRDDAYRELASAYQQLGRAADAERAYRLAIELLPRYWAGYNQLGAFYYSQARYAEAAEMFRRVTELVPDNSRGHLNLAGVYILQRRYADAIAPLERSIALVPSAAAYSNLATAFFYLRDYPKAVRNYEEAVKLEDSDHRSWGNLAEAYFWAPGMRDRAPQAYRKALALASERLKVNRRDPGVYGSIAKWHAMLGEKDLALQNLQRGLALAPASSKLFLDAALVHHRLGDDAKSMEWIQRALHAGQAAAVIQDDPFFDDLSRQPRFQQLMKTQPTSGGSAP